MRPRIAGITPRQQQVWALIAQGLENKEICKAQGLANGTIKCHVCALLNKTGARNRVELALRWHGVAP